MASNTSTVGKLLVELLFDGKQFEKGTKKAEKTTSKMADRMNKLTKSIETGLTVAFKGLTLAIGGFVAASAVVGVQFEAQMARIGAITGATEAQFQALTEQARKLGATTEFTATQAAEALTEFAKAGATVDEAIGSSNAALLLAGTSGAGLADATQLMVAAQRQFGLTTEDSTRITDVFSKAMRTSLLDFSSLREAMKIAGTTGAAFGMSIEETTAAVAAFRDLGLEGSLAGTNFRMAMVAAATGTDKQKKALQGLNLTLSDINPETNSFAEIIEKVGDAGITATQAIEIFGSRAGSNIAQLATQTREGSISIQEFTDNLVDSGGQTAQMYKRIGDTVQFQSKLALSALQDLSLSVFSSFSKPLQSAIEAIAPLLGSISKGFEKVSSDISKRLGSAVERLVILVKANEQAIVNTFIRTAEAVATLVITFADLIPLVDDFAIIIGTAFVAMKVHAYTTALLAIVPAATTAAEAVAALGAALTLSTGGLLALGAALSVVVAGLALYVSNASQATRNTAALTAAQQELEGQSNALAKAEEERLSKVLNKQATKIRELLDSEAALTDETRRKLEESLKLTAAEARLAKQRGELIEIDGLLVKTEEALADGGSDVREMVKSLGKATVEAANAMGKQIETADKLVAQYDKAAESGEAYANFLLKNLSDALGVQVSSIEEATVALEDLRRTQQQQGEQGEALINKAALSHSRKTAQVVRGLQEEADAVNKVGASVDDLTEKRKAASDATLQLERQLIQQLRDVGASEEQVRLNALQVRIDQVNNAINAELELYTDNVSKVSELEEIRSSMRLSAINAFLAEESDLQRKQTKRLESERTSALERTIRRVQQIESRGLDEVSRLKADKEKFFNEAVFSSGEDRVRAEIAWGKLITDAEERLQAQKTSALESAEAERMGIRARGLRSAMSAFSAAGNLATSLLSVPLQALEQSFPTVFGSAADLLVTTLGPAVEMVSKAFSALGNSIIRAFSKLGKPIKEIGKGLRESAEEGGRGFERMAARAALALGEIGKSIAGIAQGVFALGGSLTGLVSSLTGLDLSPGAFIQGATQATVGARQEDPSASASVAAKTFVQEMISGAVEFVSAMVDSLPFLLQSITEQIPTLMHSVVESIPILVQGLIDNVPSVINAVVAEIPRLVQSIADAIPLLTGLVVEQLPIIVQSLTDALPGLVATLLESIPDIIGGLLEGVKIIISRLPEILSAILSMLPEIITALLLSVGDIVAAIAAAIPGIIQAVIDNLPEIVTALVKGAMTVVVEVAKAVPTIITSLIEALPELIDTIIGLIPDVITAIIDALPDIIFALIAAIPQIISALILAIPQVMFALIQAIPELVVHLVSELVRVAPQIVSGIITAAVEGVAEIGRAIAKAFIDLVTGANLFRGSEDRRAPEERRGLRSVTGAVGDAFVQTRGEREGLREVTGAIGDLFRSREANDQRSAARSARGGTGAFSGINYIPAPMRVTVHPGEAVIPADRNPHNPSLQGPAQAGSSVGMGGGGRDGSIEIAIIAEGRLLEGVQIQANQRGTATDMSKSVRRTSDVEVGFDRGPFNKFQS